MNSRNFQLAIKGRGTKAQQGQAMVEFMLTVVFLTLLVVGIVEMLGFIYTYSVIADAAKEGVRYAIVHGANNTTQSGPTTQQTAKTPPCTSSNNNNSTAPNVINRVTQFAGFSMHDTSNMNVYVCYLDGNNKSLSQVQVSIAYSFRPLFGFGWPSVTVYANSAGRIVY